MKRLLKATLVLWLAVGLQNCADDENAGTVEKVQFTFDFKTAGPDGGRVQATADLPPGTSLMVSIDNLNGEPVLNHFRIELLKVGDSYMSNPIELLPGRYRLKDFMLVSGDSVLYATPRSGSPFATAVVHALPFNFSIRKNVVANIPMEVVDVSQSEPEDFGYASFNVSVVEGEPFQVSVFIPAENGMTLTTANAFILKDGDTLSTYALKAKVNTIFFKENENESYTLVVSKDGYASYSRQFVFTELLVALGGKPLAVNLGAPALTMVAENYISSSWFSTNSSSTTFQVNWGDGTIEQLQESNDRLYELNHSYANPGQYTTIITGDIHTIINFANNGDGRSDGLLSVDFSHAEALEDVEFIWTGIRSIQLAKNAPVRRIHLEECYNFEKASLDELIENRYAYVVENNFTNGNIFLTKDADGDMIGPPSQASFEKLRTMATTYHWNVPTDYHAYRLDLFYEKEYDGGLFPGAFKETDHVSFEFRVTQYGVPIVKFLGPAYGGGAKVSPGTVEKDSCTSEHVLDYYYSSPFYFLDPFPSGPTAIATVIFPGGGQPMQLKIDFKNLESKEPTFEYGCPFGPDNSWVGGAELHPDVNLPDATFIMNHEVQTYHNATNTVTGTLTPMVFN